MGQYRKVRFMARRLWVVPDRVVVVLVVGSLVMLAGCGHSSRADATLRVEVTSSGESVSFFLMVSDAGFPGPTINGVTPFSREFEQSRHFCVPQLGCGGSFFSASVRPSVKTAATLTLCVTDLHRGNRQCSSNAPPNGLVLVDLPL